MLKVKIINIFVIIIIFTIFICFQYQNIEFDYKLNGNNIICYNTNIDEKEIEEFIKYYSIKVNQFYIGNALTNKKIELENLIIILCKNSFSEWDYSFSIREKLIKDFGYNKLSHFIYRSFSNHDKFAEAFYVRSGVLPVIFIRQLDYKINTFFDIIVEYNHHLIQSNENCRIFDTFFRFWIDDGFTNFLAQYFSWFDYYKYIDKYEKYLEDNIISIEEEDSKIIFDMYVKELFTNKNFIPFKFQNDAFKIDFSTFLNEKNEIRSLIYKYIVIFYSYLHAYKGLEKFYGYLNFLYNKSYSSLDEIFINCYNISFYDLLKELDNFILNY